MSRRTGKISSKINPGKGLRKTASAPVEIADLLGRKTVNLDTPELQRFIAGKIILVSGAGGSIGSEICRQIMKFCPQRLILVERAENALFEIDRELQHRWIGADIRPYICDITDRARVDDVLTSERPSVIFHCAAHKHVPMMEANPGEAIKNNIFGTKTIADAAIEHGVNAFVMVSTDKAVNPTSVMGASKRVAELYVQSLNNHEREQTDRWQSDHGSEAGNRNGDAARNRNGDAASFLRPADASRTRFTCVRFGNVLGSSGSVVPIFNKQIDAGGPVTVTHPDMQRYFMTIPEASQLVMQAGAIGRGGEIFVLDMGQPVKIVDLAKEMIRRRGLKVGKDIEIRFSGIRPGEKLFEELSCPDEETAPTSHQKIRVWQLPKQTAEQIERNMATLLQSTRESKPEMIAALCSAVPEYTPESKPRPIAATLNTAIRIEKAA